MARTVNLVVGCTNRKRQDVVPGLAVRELRTSDLPSRLRLWRERLQSVSALERPADELYMGEHWSVVRSIPQEASKRGWDVRLWVCSAGYGLIRTDTRIKAYQATFTPGVPDFVASGLTYTNVLQDWWIGVSEYCLQDQDDFPRSLSALAKAFPRTPMVVALSADYLKAVQVDLLGALQSSFFKEHLSIISCGTKHPHPIWKENLLPGDAMMTCALGGTLTSLNARVARFLFRSVGDQEINVQSMTGLTRLIERQTRLIPERKPRSDSQVAGYIRSNLKRNPKVSKTRLLEEFRTSGNACEQKRFGEIYTQLRQKVVSNLHV